MKNMSLVRWIAVCLTVLILGGCGAGDESAGQTETGYPEPRFPSYLRKPISVEDAMPYARAAVRQTGGRTPLGQVEPGKTVALFAGERSVTRMAPRTMRRVTRSNRCKKMWVKVMAIRG